MSSQYQIPRDENIFNYSPQYHFQKPHWDLGNKIAHSKWYKRLIPFRTQYETRPMQDKHVPLFYGVPPRGVWLYGNLDYTMNKEHKLIQAHDDWYPDRKAKTLGMRNGGLSDSRGHNTTQMILVPEKVPRGCQREIKKFQDCKKQNGGQSDACFTKKIGILEVCPNHILHQMSEMKKNRLRQLKINNETYKRAMQLSDYNFGRNVNNLPPKTFAHGEGYALRPDSYWYDDRYDPTIYKHSHRFDNQNFPDQEYQDFFGGNIGEKENKEKDLYKIGFFKSFVSGTPQKVGDMLGNQPQSEQSLRDNHLPKPKNQADQM